MKLQLILNDAPEDILMERLRLALNAGIDWVQLRLKSANDSANTEIARLVIEYCHLKNAKCILNDHVELAVRLNADGVHVGRDDMHPGKARLLIGPNKIIGVSANTFSQLFQSYPYADYIGVGPFRETTTKLNHSEVLGLDGYANILQLKKDAGINTPVIAIGGITPSDATLLFHLGIDGIAVSGAIEKAADIPGAIHAFKQYMK